MKKYEHAFNYVNKAIDVSEHEDWRALVAMGCILSDYKQDYHSAQDYFNRSERLNPGSNLVNLNKSQNLILLGLYIDAEKLLKGSILDKIASAVLKIGRRK